MKHVMLKKMIGVPMAAVMLVSLAACGDKGQEVTPAVTAADGPMGAYEQTLLCGLGKTTQINPRMPDGDTYENNAYTRYLKDRLNIEVSDVFEANGDDYDRQVALAIASGELPDIMRVPTKDVLDELVENDLVADLTDVYDQYASDYIKEVYDTFNGRSLDEVTYDGKLMALPGTNGDSAPCEVFIRQDWLDALGMQVDADGDGCLTVDEVGTIAKTFIDKDPGQSGNPVGMAFSPTLVSNDYGLSGHSMMAISSAYNAFPSSWLTDENGTVYNGTATDNMKEALAKLAQWYQEGIVDPQFGTRTGDDIITLLTNGQLGVAFGPWHMPDWLLGNVRAMDADAQFSVFTICNDQGKVNAIHAKATSDYMVVRKGYSNPEALIKMANLFFDEIPNNKNLAVDAPEVSEYLSAVDNTTMPIQVGIYKATSLLDDYSDIKKCVNGEITIDEVRNTGSRAAVQNIQNYLADPVGSDASGWAMNISRMGGLELMSKLTENGTFAWTTPAFYDMTETMKTNQVDLDKLQEETFVAIVTGAKPIDAFDTFVTDWMARGGEQITKEVNELVSNG